MKKLLSIIALSVLVLLPASCSKSNEKAEELLNSVPKTTSGVCLINLERLAKEAGITKEGDNIILPQSLKTLFEGNREAESLFTSGALEMSVLALYEDAETMCVTGFTADPAKLSEIMGEDVTVRDNRFWLTERKRLTARIADNAQALAADDSFGATGYSSTLTDLDGHDMRAIANIQGLVALSGNTQAQMGMGLLGSLGGAKYVTFDLTSSKGKVEMALGVLNSDFNKIDTPDLPGIDLKGIEKLHGRMEIVGALAVNEKMMKDLSQNLPNLLGKNLPVADASALYNLIGSIDGTIAVGATLTNTDLQWEVAVPFSGDKGAKEALAYANMFTEGSSIFTRQEKNIMLVSNANFTSPLDGPQNQADLKGQFMGIAAGQALFTNPNIWSRRPIPVKAATLTVGKKDGTQILTLTIATTGDRNGLLSLLEWSATL